MQTLGTIEYVITLPTLDLVCTQTDAANGGKLHHSMIIVPEISHFACCLLAL